MSKEQVQEKKKAPKGCIYKKTCNAGKEECASCPFYEEQEKE